MELLDLSNKQFQRKQYKKRKLNPEIQLELYNRPLQKDVVSIGHIYYFVKSSKCSICALQSVKYLQRIRDHYQNSLRSNSLTTFRNYSQEEQLFRCLQHLEYYFGIAEDIDTLKKTLKVSEGMYL